MSTTATTPAITPTAVTAPFVTVLHGYGRVPAHDVHSIDDVVFHGGVAHHVPAEQANHWLKGTRADGKPVSGRIVVQVLPDDADEGDYARAAGIQAITPGKLGAMLKATELGDLVAALGPERALALADGIRTQLKK